MLVLTRSVKEVLLLLLSAILAAAVVPFAYVRLRDEQWAVAMLDLGIISVMLALFLYVYFSRKTVAPGIIMALVFIASALMTTLLLGVGQIYWSFPALTAIFFMLDTRPASLLSLGYLVGILGILWEGQSAIALATISLALVTTTLFAYAFAATNRQQQSQLRHQANVDPLTGAGNRRAQNEKLDTVNAIFRRSQIPGSVLIFDVDLFKKVNDEHGHVVGDQILVEIADLIRSNTRATENLYRYGGEEFVVIAEHTKLESATLLAEKLRAMVELKTFCSGIHITVSVGVAEVLPGEGRAGWLSRADSALFRAKGSGRNRVIVAPAHETMLPVITPALAATAESS